MEGMQRQNGSRPSHPLLLLSGIGFVCEIDAANDTRSRRRRHRHRLLPL